MKIATCAFFVLFFCATVFAQTVNLGQNVFYNDEGALVLTADAAVAVLKLNSPYIMLMLYMGTKEKQSITVNQNDVVMIYKDQEFKMPTIKELEERYKDQVNDADLYLRLGKESLALSRMRYWKYEAGVDFFPPPGQGTVAVDERSIVNDLGFRTRAYFKNPGFKKGDQIVINVKDKNKPGLRGSVAVVFE